jgi:hypothetical protein
MRAVATSEGKITSEASITRGTAGTSSQKLNYAMLLIFHQYSVFPKS